LANLVTTDVKKGRGVYISLTKSRLKTDKTADVFKAIYVGIIKNKNSISETLGKLHFHESHGLESIYGTRA